eukprot:2218754-Amphidinium_carterae.1
MESVKEDLVANMAKKEASLLAATQYIGDFGWEMLFFRRFGTQVVHQDMDRSMKASKVEMARCYQDRVCHNAALAATLSESV